MSTSRPQKKITLERLAEMLKGFATKADFERFATKTDLGRFATKADLKQFPTKTDLERFATKADLERFATKADIEDLALMTAKQFTAIDSRFDRLEGRLEGFIQETKENFSKVRKDIFTIKDTYATREELRALVGQA